MANELSIVTATGSTVYAVGRVANKDNLGKWGNISDTTLDDFVAGDWTKYAITMTELGTTGIFQADFPTVFAGEHAVDIIYVLQAGASPDQGDTKLYGSLYELHDSWVPVQSIEV